MRFPITAVVVVVLVIGVIAGATYLTMAQQAPSSSGTTFVVTENTPYHCGTAKSFTQNGYTLLIEESLNAKVGAQVCLNLILNNSGTQPISITGDTLSLNVTDSRGGVVFHDFFAVTQPNATLSPGQTYTGTTFWDTSQATNGVTPTAGTYVVVANAIDSNGKPMVSTSAQFSLTSS
jgi:hypothetical protein